MPSQVPLTPKASQPSWGQWRRQPHGLEPGGKCQGAPSRCPPPTSNNPVKLSPAWVNLFPQTHGRLFRRHVGIFRVCVRSHSSSLGFFGQWLLPLPRQHAPFSSGSPLTLLPRATQQPSAGLWEPSLSSPPTRTRRDLEGDTQVSSSKVCLLFFPITEEMV